MVKEFIELCKFTQDELLLYIPKFLSKFYPTDKIITTNNYIYVQGEIPVLLVAHLDTVHKDRVRDIWFSEDRTKVKSDQGIGGDDRCGVYALNYIASKYNGKKPYLLYTTDEEIGCVGTEKFCEENDVLPVYCAIEIDRKGSHDAVIYEDGNNKLLNVFENLGFKEAFGSFTDICTISEKYGVSSINLSSGYYNPHTLDEYVCFPELMTTIKRVMEFLDNPDFYSEVYPYEPLMNNWYGFGNYGLDRFCVCELCGNNFSGFKYYETCSGMICQECYEQYKDGLKVCPYCEGISYIEDKYCDICGLKFEES